MKTIICDIDGTIFKYSPNGHDAIANEDPELLPGAKEKFLDNCELISKRDE